MSDADDADPFLPDIRAEPGLGGGEDPALAVIKQDLDEGGLEIEPDDDGGEPYQDREDELIGPHDQGPDPTPEESPTMTSIDIMSPPVPNGSESTSPETVPVAAPSASDSVVAPDVENPCPDPGETRRRHGIPRLDQMCCQVIAQHVTSSAALDQLPGEYVASVLSSIDPAQVGIVEAGRRLHCDALWRLMSSQWPLGDVRQHGGSHKRMFFEKLIQERFQSYHQTSRSQVNRHELVNELDVARPYVHAVAFNEQRSHLNLATVLHGFFNLTRLDMRYGAYNLGMMFDDDDAGMKGNDVVGLNQLLAETKSLSALLIRESLLSDELAGVLCKGLAQNQTVTHLDLSHNRIGDDAAQKLAHVLAQPDTVLIRLNLADNSLGPGAGAALAEVLRFNTVLQQLSLRLNAIAAPGAISLLKALKGNATLTSLNISCNGAYDIAPDLIELMHANRTLQSIDVSGNDAIAAKDSAALLDAVKSMSQLTDLDLRLNPRLQAEEDAEIRYQLNGRQERLDRARRVSYLTDRGSLE